MKRFNLGKRIHKYFTDKPKQDFWFWAFITLLVFRYVSPIVLIFAIPFQVGLIAPDANINYQSIASNVSNNLIGPLEKINTLGVQIGSNHPILGKVIYYALANTVWVIYVAMIVLITNLVRYGISYIYRYRKRKGRKK